MADRSFENKLNSEGFKYIAGTDEAGRGPLAGPLVVAACILPNDYTNEAINDSKKLTEAKREALYDEIITHCLAYSITIIAVETIDKINIYEASRKGMSDCIKKLKLKPDAILTDCMKLFGFEQPVIDIVKGDAKSITIAAASILAKVTRDRLMIELDKKYPEYDFKNNKGYGTKKHLDALQLHGFTDIHRKTYDPVKSMIQKQQQFDF